MKIPTPQEKEDSLNKFQYIVKLIHWNYNEGLLDKFSFFQQLLNQFKETTGMEELYQYSIVVFPYVSQICLNRNFLEMLIQSCFRKLEKVLSLLSIIIFIISKIIYFIFLCLHNLLHIIFILFLINKKKRCHQTIKI